MNINKFAEVMTKRLASFVANTKNDESKEDKPIEYDMDESDWFESFAFHCGNEATRDVESDPSAV